MPTKKIKRSKKSSEKHDPSRGHEYEAVSESELFGPFEEDLRDAFAKLKNWAIEMNTPRIYNNARAVMFARRVCYMFVRPKKTYLELTFFLSRKEEDLSIKKIDEVSKNKFAHTIRVVHADQIEYPLTDWLSEAFRLSI
jgi:hypothetical protein